MSDGFELDHIHFPNKETRICEQRPDVRILQRGPLETIFGRQYF